MTTNPINHLDRLHGNRTSLEDPRTNLEDRIPLPGVGRLLAGAVGRVRSLRGIVQGASKLAAYLYVPFARSTTRFISAGACSLLLASAAVAGVFFPDGATTLHFAFEGNPNGDRPVIRPPEFYHADDGFGFVDSPGLIGTARGVTAPRYFRFDVNVPPGTYDVTVVLGGTDGESVTNINAEKHPLVADVHVARGATATKSFTVTVPAADAVAGRAGHESSRLTLEFEGHDPSLMKLDVKPAGQK